jgi:hypothetical protein
MKRILLTALAPGAAFIVATAAHAYDKANVYSSACYPG